MFKAKPGQSFIELAVVLVLVVVGAVVIVWLFAFDATPNFARVVGWVQGFVNKLLHGSVPAIIETLSLIVLYVRLLSRRDLLAAALVTITFVLFILLS